MRLTCFLFTALSIVAVTQPAVAASTQFSQLFVFGDSLSDTGNNYIATNGQGLGMLGTNYWSGRFTDGPTTTPATTGPIGNWVDQFSAKVGFADPAPSLAGGSNYAFGGASTGSAQPYDISNQLANFLVAHPAGAPSDALYVLWGGSNDFQNGSGDPLASADNLYANILTLAGGGAKTFMWFNLPGGAGAPGLFNRRWSTDLERLHELGIDVIGVDVSNLFSQINANPSAYGFTNTQNPAQGQQGVNPNDYLFWDTRRHPTTTTHALIADLAFNDLASAPEPSDVALVLAGLLGIASLNRFRQSRGKVV